LTIFDQRAGLEHFGFLILDFGLTPGKGIWDFRLSIADFRLWISTRGKSILDFRYSTFDFRLPIFDQRAATVFSTFDFRLSIVDCRFSISAGQEHFES
jgi:hypothetical protein